MSDGETAATRHHRTFKVFDLVELKKNSPGGSLAERVTALRAWPMFSLLGRDGVWDSRHYVKLGDPRETRQSTVDAGFDSEEDRDDARTSFIAAGGDPCTEAWAWRHVAKRWRARAEVAESTRSSNLRESGVQLGLSKKAFFKYAGCPCDTYKELDYWREAFFLADEMLTPKPFSKSAALPENRLEARAVKVAEFTERALLLSRIGEQIDRCSHLLDGSASSEMPLADGLKTLGRIKETQQRLVALAAQKGGAA